MGRVRRLLWGLALPLGIALLPVTGAATNAPGPASLPVNVPTSLPVNVPTSLPVNVPSAVPTLPPVPVPGVPAPLPAVALPPAPAAPGPNAPVGAAPAAALGPSGGYPSAGEPGAGSLAVPSPAGSEASFPVAVDAQAGDGLGSEGLAGPAGTAMNAAAAPATLGQSSPGSAEPICPKLVLAPAPGCPAVLEVVTSLARSGLQLTWGAAGLLLALFGWVIVRRSRGELRRRPPVGR